VRRPSGPMTGCSGWPCSRPKPKKFGIAPPHARFSEAA
jgi:hypothetical protein